MGGTNTTFDKWFIGAQTALILGALGILGGLANIGNGEHPGITALVTAPTRISAPRRTRRESADCSG